MRSRITWKLHPPRCERLLRQLLEHAHTIFVLVASPSANRGFFVIQSVYTRRRVAVLLAVAEVRCSLGLRRRRRRTSRRR
jgi:hypothetical protein